MANVLSNIANNFSEEIHRINHNDKKCETYGIKCKYCDYFLEYKNFKDDLIKC